MIDTGPDKGTPTQTDPDRSATADLRRLSDAATAGPWEYEFKNRFAVPVDIDVTEADWGGKDLREYRMVCEGDRDAWRAEDVQFVVAAVNYVRTMLAGGES